MNQYVTKFTSTSDFKPSRVVIELHPNVHQYGVKRPEFFDLFKTFKFVIPDFQVRHP